MILITSDFDHGNMRVISSSNPADIQLEIEPDGSAKFYQWFNFRIDEVAGETLSMRIQNAGGASYAAGWEGYRACASYDGENWFRVDTSYADDTLTINHTPEQNTVHYAYFAAYPYERLAAFVARTKSDYSVQHECLGKSVDDRPLDCFTVGQGPLKFWVIARQHPGETMGSWWMEGFLPQIAGDGDAAKALRESATIYVVPCMNPDGAARGHLRTNAEGIDLNRAWRNTSIEKSPEVFAVRNKMRETGVDFFLDVHGDEAIPNNFLVSAHGIPSWNTDMQAQFDRYSALLLGVSDDFQTKDGYPLSPSGKANLDIANNYVAETWGCLSMTLEMPFKDANVNPMPDFGWSPERCRNFAREHLEVMAKIVGELG